MNLLDARGNHVGRATISCGRVVLHKIKKRPKKTLQERFKFQEGVDYTTNACYTPKLRPAKEGVMQELSKDMFQLAFKLKGASADRLRAAVRELEANLADARQKNDMVSYRAALTRARSIYNREIAADLIHNNVCESV